MKRCSQCRIAISLHADFYVFCHAPRAQHFAMWHTKTKIKKMYQKKIQEVKTDGKIHIPEYFLDKLEVVKYAVNKIFIYKSSISIFLTGALLF